MEQDSDRRPDLRELGDLFAQSVSEDLSGLFDRGVKVSSPAVDEGKRDGLLAGEGSLVCASCGEGVYVATSLRAALVLATAQLGKTPDDFAEVERGPFEGEVEQAYRSAMDVCVGIFGRVLDEEAGLPSLQLSESARVELPVSGPMPEQGSYRRARFPLAIDGFESEHLDILIASDRAREWFGDLAVGGAGATEGGAIALIDPDPDSRAAFAELADSLGCDVLTLDPAELGEEFLEELAETSRVVLTWDLGGRLGLDVLEQLNLDEATATLRIAIATDRPTRAMVDAALRWGAYTVLFQPWDADEISRRLLA